jgi:hypothetical protein
LAHQRQRQPHTHIRWCRPTGGNFVNIAPSAPGIPSVLQAFSIDPENNQHIIVGFHDNCQGEFAPMCFGETTDGAANWHFINGPTKGWGEGAGPVIIKGNTWLYGAPFDGLYYTNDGSKTWEELIEYPGRFSGVTPLVDGNYYIGCFNAIMRSPDAHTWTPIDNTRPSSLRGRICFRRFKRQQQASGVDGERRRAHHLEQRQDSRD